jgi:hypothetical protein
VQVGDLMTQVAQGQPNPSRVVIRDADVEVTCRTCGTVQTLDHARVRQSSGSFFYRCSEGCPGPMVVVRGTGGGFMLEVKVLGGLRLHVKPPN